MSPRIFFGYKAIVVNKIVVASVVRRVNEDALHLPGECHPQEAQHVLVVTFNEEISPRCSAYAFLTIEVERHKIIVQRLVTLNLVGFPNQAEARGIALIARFKEAEHFFPVKMIVT
jgi:hypothetical protein